jgi:hypothetical protein
LWEAFSLLFSPGIEMKVFEGAFIKFILGEWLLVEVDGAPEVG